MTSEPDRTTADRTRDTARDPGPATVRTPTEARQGRPLGRMRFGLAPGMIGVAARFAIACPATRPRAVGDGDGGAFPGTSEALSAFPSQRQERSDIRRRSR